MSPRVISHGLAVLMLVAVIASFSLISESRWSPFPKLESGVVPLLTGAASRNQVGYVAVKDAEALQLSFDAIRYAPVTLKTGTFRGHYFLRIEGAPNNVRAATTTAAIAADIRHGLVFSGIQLE